MATHQLVAAAATLGLDSTIRLPKLTALLIEWNTRCMKRGAAEVVADAVQFLGRRSAGTWGEPEV